MLPGCSICGTSTTNMTYSLKETVELLESYEIVGAANLNQAEMEGIIFNCESLSKCFPIGPFHSIHGLLLDLIDSGPLFYNTFLEKFLETPHIYNLINILRGSAVTTDRAPRFIYDATFTTKYHDCEYKDELLELIDWLDKNGHLIAYYPPIPQKDDKLTDCQVEYWKMALKRTPLSQAWRFERKIGGTVYLGRRVDRNVTRFNWLCKPRVESQTRVYLEEGFYAYQTIYLPYTGYIENQTVLRLICDIIERFVEETRQRPNVKLNPHLCLLLKYCTKCPNYNGKSKAERLVLEMTHGKFDSLKEVLEDLRVIRDWPPSIQSFVMECFGFGLDGLEFMDSSRFCHNTWSNMSDYQSQNIEFDAEWEDLKGVFANNLQSSRYNVNLYLEFLLKTNGYERSETLIALIESKYASKIYWRLIRQNDKVIHLYISSANDEAYKRVVGNINVKKIAQLMRTVHARNPKTIEILKNFGKQRAYDLLRRGAFLSISPKNYFFRPCEDDDDIDSVIKSICRREIPDLTILSYKMIVEQLPPILRKALFKLLERQLSLYMSPQNQTRLRNMSLIESFDWKGMPMEDIIENDELRMAMLCMLFSKMKSSVIDSDQFQAEFHLFTILAHIQLCRRTGFQ